MRSAVERVVLRAGRAWASDRVRLVVLTLYYFAILAGLLALRGTRVPSTRFVYQEF